eukprot:2397510-Prymnesium_polylepis.1
MQPRALAACPTAPRIPRRCALSRRHLRRRRQVAVDLIDLLLEALAQHLVGLVEYQHLDSARAQVAPPDHVEDAAGRPRDGVHAGVEAADVLADRLAADARVALHAHVVAEREHHLLRLLRQLARR